MSSTVLIVNFPMSVPTTKYATRKRQKKSISFPAISTKIIRRLKAAGMIKIRNSIFVQSTRATANSTSDEAMD